MKGLGAKTVVLNFLTLWPKREVGWADLEQVLLTDYRVAKWKGSNRKQSTRWQHLYRLKASAFCIW